MPINTDTMILKLSFFYTDFTEKKQARFTIDHN